MAATQTQIRYPQLHDPRWLREQVNAGCSTIDIARVIGCAEPSVREALLRNGIQVRRTCKVCGETFDYDVYKAHRRHCKRPVNQTIRTATCPHCGEHFPPSTVNEHAERCYRNPAAYAITQELLNDGNGVIMSREKYIVRRAGTQAMSHHLLLKLFGSWSAVATAFGLLSSTEAADALMAKELADERVTMELERSIVEAEKHRGLSVCGMRALPTGGVAFMLR